ncbi:hypothetical protein [Marinomonas profundimaris]|uniref:Uncharacterized protein n=1 Tax=Marinomonas profundimaris TaxID=1208321 RepID=W1S106_9GAMM|nr:hypothetical protein [Marinomonas profundimaris]ETI61689.1 hypothetical protein D104_04670 [Marinomonas profundimaris]
MQTVLLNTLNGALCYQAELNKRHQRKKPFYQADRLMKVTVTTALHC